MSHPTLHTLHNALHTVTFPLYNPNFTHRWSTHSAPPALYTPLSILRARHPALHTLRHTLKTLYRPCTLNSEIHTPRPSLRTLHTALYTPRLTLHTLHFRFRTLRVTPYASHSTLYILRPTLSTRQLRPPLTPHAPHSTLHAMPCSTPD